jgi:phage gpG-like protein
MKIMASKNNLSKFEQAILARINKRVKKQRKSRFSERPMRNKAQRIGALLTLQTKKNIRGHRLIDTGRLINSIGFFASRTSEKGFILEYGSFGVKYAGVHEFGSQKTVTVPGHTRQQTHVWGKKVDPFTVNVRTFTRKQNILEKPFIRPSVKQRRDQIIKILMGEEMA